MMEEGCPVAWQPVASFISGSPFRELYEWLLPRVLAAVPPRVIGWKCSRAPACDWRDRSAHSERPVDDVCPKCRVGTVALLYSGEI